MRHALNRCFLTHKNARVLCSSKLYGQAKQGKGVTTPISSQPYGYFAEMGAIRTDETCRLRCSNKALPSLQRPFRRQRRLHQLRPVQGGICESTPTGKVAVSDSAQKSSFIKLQLTKHYNCDRLH